MDIISDVMQTIRFTGNIFLHTNFSGQWGAHFQAVNLPVFHCVLRGSAWVGTDQPDSFIKLQQGDIAFLPGGIDHFIANSPESDRMQMTIVPGHNCMQTDVPDSEAEVQLLCGVFQTKDDFQHPLFTTLPDLMHVQFSNATADTSVHRHVAYIINDAIKENSAGTDILIDRLYEILFIQLLQKYFSDHDSVDSFYNSPAMTRVSEVLKEIHKAPAAPWTLDEMAERAYMSRSAFTSNFRKCVGLSPMAYLMLWRMNKARSLIRNTGLSFRAIARKVGYRTQMGLNKAFKQHFGHSPKELRK